MRKFPCFCLAVSLSVLLGAGEFPAASSAVIAEPPLPPAHVSGRVIDPHAPAQPLPARRAAPQGRPVRHSEAVPSTSRPVPAPEGGERGNHLAPSRPEATSPASYEGAAPQGHAVPQG